MSCSTQGAPLFVSTKPFRFSVNAQVELSPAEVMDQILEVSRWSDFPGYGFIPGIDKAQFQVWCDEIVDSRILVENTDGSRHVEEVVDYVSEQRICFEMKEFDSVVAHLVDHIEETWTLEADSKKTSLTRTFALHSAHWVARPLVWVVSQMLKRAVLRHMELFELRSPRGERSQTNEEADV